MVSAAFIGPGTVTTAARAGNLYGTGLLWTLLFSTLACLLLQEASARVTLKTGMNIGEAMKSRLNDSFTGKLLLALTAIAITGGAAAYQMGNLLGAREGLALIMDGDPRIYTVLIGLIAGLVLYIPSLKIVARIMGIMVIILGISFLYSAILIKPSLPDMARGLFVPSLPDSTRAPLLILGLIGTTIVPYNLFLGSGLGSANKDIKEMRFGLVIAIILGGIFSMAVVIVGSAVTGEFSFEELARTLGQEGGKAGSILLGTGLFAAGFTSAITAPLASAITLKSLFGNTSPKWQENGTYYRLGWMFVLFTGLFFALLGFKPIPAIISAQALNGFILPFVSFFLVWILNSKSNPGGNPMANNILLGITLVITLLIGLRNLVNVTGIDDIITSSTSFSMGLTAVSLIITLVFMLKILKK